MQVKISDLKISDADKYPGYLNKQMVLKKKKIETSLFK